MRLDCLKKLNDSVVEGVDEKSQRAELFRFAHLLWGDSNQSNTSSSTFARVRARSGNYRDAMTWSRDMWNHLHSSAETIASSFLVEVSDSLLRHKLSNLESDDDDVDEDSIRNEKVTEGCAELLCKAVATCDLENLDTTLSFWQLFLSLSLLSAHTQTNTNAQVLTWHTPHFYTARGDFGKLLNTRLYMSCHRVFTKHGKEMITLFFRKIHPLQSFEIRIAWWWRSNKSVLVVVWTGAELLATRTNLLLHEPAVAVSAMLQKSTRSARVDAHLCFSFMLLLMSEDKSSIYRQAIRDIKIGVSRWTIRR